nr:tumor necrosis factor receptor superfamily member 1A [Onchidium reevesii]
MSNCWTTTRSTYRTALSVVEMESSTLKYLLLVAALILMITPVAESELPCRIGRVLTKGNGGYKSYYCPPCPPGTFISEDFHSYTECFNCTKVVDPNLEILVLPCNTEKNTHIECVDGYFRTTPACSHIDGHCQKCTECEFLKHPCTKQTDAVCCSAGHYRTDNVTHRRKREASKCVPMCGQDQYLDSTTAHCLACPDNTKMPEIRHRHTSCWKCNIPRSHHQILIQACNSSHPGVIGCIDGYYRPSSSTTTADPCTKCQVCSENNFGHVFERRGCDPFHDTVCCPHPDMAVVDTPRGPQCQHFDAPGKDVWDTHKVISCGVGEHFSIGPDGRSVVCVPCPIGTCMTETRHFTTKCRPCDTWEDPFSSGQMRAVGGTQTLSLTCLVITWTLTEMFLG